MLVVFLWYDVVATTGGDGVSVALRGITRRTCQPCLVVLFLCVAGEEGTAHGATGTTSQQEERRAMVTREEKKKAHWLAATAHRAAAAAHRAITCEEREREAWQATLLASYATSKSQAVCGDARPPQAALAQAMSDASQNGDEESREKAHWEAVLAHEETAREHDKRA